MIKPKPIRRATKAASISREDKASLTFARTLARLTVAGIDVLAVDAGAVVSSLQTTLKTETVRDESDVIESAKPVPAIPADRQLPAAPRRSRRPKR